MSLLIQWSQAKPSICPFLDPSRETESQRDTTYTPPNPSFHPIALYRLACAGAATSRRRVCAVFRNVGKVSVRRPRCVAHGAIVAWALILVGHKEANRCPQREAKLSAAQDGYLQDVASDSVRGETWNGAVAISKTSADTTRTAKVSVAE